LVLFSCCFVTPLLKLTILDKSDQELQVLHPFTLE
jgi:hypothetical protein